MRSTVRAAFLAALFAAASQPARAWEFGIGPGARLATQTEFDAAGRRLVRESGWLPGVAFQAAYRTGALAWSGGAEWYQGGIGYQGHTQTGTAADSTTSTRLAALRGGAAWTLAGESSLLAALEIDRWRRDIAGTALGAGLQETYRSTRLLVGAAKVWQGDAGRLSADASALFSGPEHMRVGFSGQFDTVPLTTSRGHGVRLGVALRPAWAPRLEWRTRVDWLRVPRSGDAPLTAGGEFRGTIAQPEHLRQAITTTVSALF